MGVGSLLPAAGWQRAALLGCAVLACLHQATHWHWMIEDAAICFAYARNFVEGHGLVPFPGGERIEGYSDPTWVLLLAIFQAVGLSGFVVAKPLAMVFTALTMPLVWRSAHLALDEEADGWALLAPFALAVYSQHAIWASSGLENALFCFVLAAAILATVLDARQGRSARSAGAFLALAWTRPEGVGYAAIGGAWWLLWLVRHGHRPVRPTLAWLALFFGPSAALEAARLWYFAWPQPNTYYAKVVARITNPTAWDWRGWNQVREWAGRLWFGWMFPVYLLGLAGRPRPLREAVGPALAWAASAFAFALLMWPGPAAIAALWLWPDLPAPPEAFVLARTGVLVAVGVGLPALVLRRRGADVVGLCWLLGVFALGFSVYADGDWMHAYRWMSLATPSAAVVFAVGVRELAAAVAARVTDPAAPRLAAALVSLLLLPPNLSQTRDHVTYDLDETPFRVRRRPAYVSSIASRVFWEEPIVELDMDMGAHLWWFPELREVDMAGLVDVPMSRHWYHQPAFVDEYVWTERRPTFAHVHGGWAREVKFERFAQWRDFTELPPYPDPGGGDGELHHGVWGTRRLFAAPRWEGAAADPDAPVAFARGVRVEGLEVPAPTWAAGGEGYLALGLARDASDVDPGQAGRAFRALAFLSRGADLVVRDLDVGWSGPQGPLYPVSAWRTGAEVVHHRATFAVPPDLAPGTYTLGLVILDDDGTVLPALADDLPGRTVGRGNASAYAEGELRWEGRIAVRPPGEVAARAEAALAEAGARAAEGACDEAESLRIVALRHHPRDAAWRVRVRAEVDGALATCHARLASADPENAAAHLARAHRWDPDDAALAEVGGPVGDALWAAGTAARAAGDPDTAYRAFADLLSFQPWRSWARRYAEEARDLRLGIDPHQGAVDMKTIPIDPFERGAGEAPPAEGPADAPPAE